LFYGFAFSHWQLPLKNVTTNVCQTAIAAGLLSTPFPQPVFSSRLAQLWTKAANPASAAAPNAEEKQVGFSIFNCQMGWGRLIK
jgi:hypothetical protein